MKTLILGFLFLANTSFAQSMDVNSFKDLLNSKKATLEKVNPGMSKKVVTTAAEGECNYRMTAIQTVLKIEGEKIIILSKEKFQPQNTAACRTLGYTASVDQSIVYFAPKPSVATDLVEIDRTASNIKAITRAADMVTLNLEVNGEKFTNKVDLTKPSFKNLLSTQSLKSLAVTEDMVDTDLKTVDLKKVFFCPSNDGDESDCTEGDYSDILF